MGAANSICHRCHRLRALNGAGYCAGCASELRAAERPRRAPGIGVAPSEPPPPTTAGTPAFPPLPAVPSSVTAGAPLAAIPLAQPVAGVPSKLFTLPSIEEKDETDGTGLYG